VSYQRKEYQQETRWLVAVRDDDGRTREIYVKSPPPDSIAMPFIMEPLAAMWIGSEKRTVRPTFGQRIYSWTPGDYTVMGLRVYR
jgi:hypothetical protein